MSKTYWTNGITTNSELVLVTLTHLWKESTSTNVGTLITPPFSSESWRNLNISLEMGKSLTKVTFFKFRFPFNGRKDSVVLSVPLL